MLLNSIQNDQFAINNNMPNAYSHEVNAYGIWSTSGGESE